MWLSLTTMLSIQLDPPSLLPTTFKSVPTHEAEQIALNVLGVILQTSLTALGQPEAMESVRRLITYAPTNYSNTSRILILFKRSSGVSILCVIQSPRSCAVLIRFAQMAQHFAAAFYRLPTALFDALMQCTVTSLGLQERYSLVGACTFLVSRHSVRFDHDLKNTEFLADPHHSYLCCGRTERRQANARPYSWPHNYGGYPQWLRRRGPSFCDA